MSGVGSKVAKMAKMAKMMNLDEGGKRFRDAVGQLLALTPNRHPLRGYPARRRQERGLCAQPGFLPSPLGAGRRAGDEGHLGDEGSSG
jgi:hypothetical protein